MRCWALQHVRDLKFPTINEINTPLYEPQVDQEAMYLLMLTTQNVMRIINEYSNGRHQFKKAHLFFLDGAFSIYLKFLNW